MDAFFSELIPSIDLKAEKLIANVNQLEVNSREAATAAIKLINKQREKMLEAIAAYANRESCMDGCDHKKDGNIRWRIELALSKFREALESTKQQLAQRNPVEEETHDEESLATLLSELDDFINEIESRLFLNKTMIIMPNILRKHPKNETPRGRLSKISVLD